MNGLEKPWTNTMRYCKKYHEKYKRFRLSFESTEISLHRMHGMAVICFERMKMTPYNKQIALTLISGCCESIHGRRMKLQSAQRISNWGLSLLRFFSMTASGLSSIFLLIFLADICYSFFPPSLQKWCVQLLLFRKWHTHDLCVSDDASFLVLSKKPSEKTYSYVADANDFISRESSAVALAFATKLWKQKNKAEEKKKK